MTSYRRPWIPFGASFALAAAAGTYFDLPAIALLCGTAGFAVLFLLSVLFREKAPRLGLCVPPLLAASLCALCLFAHTELVLAPAARLDGAKGEFSARVLAYPAKSGSGKAVTVRLAGGEKVSLYIAGEAELAPGDLISFQTTLHRPRAERDFNWERYYRAQGIALRAYLPESPTVTGLKRKPLDYPLLLAGSIRERVGASLPEETRGLMLGILLGGRDEMPEDLARAASRSGVAHIFAVSGMHLSILAGMVLSLFRSRKTVFFLIPLSLAFAVMTGLSPSVLRAAFVLALPLLAPWFSRESDSVSTLCAALAVLLAANPWSVASLSLQLSFGAMLGLCLYGTRLSDFLCRPAERLPHPFSAAWRFLASGASSCLSASLFTFPFLLAAFGTVSLSALLANLAVVWTMPFLFSGGFLLYSLSFLPGVAALAARVLTWLLAYVRAVLLALGGRTAELGVRDVFLLAACVFCYLSLLACLLLPPKRPTLFWAAASAGAMTVALICSALFAAGGVEVTWLSVGSGQCAAVRDGRAVVLLDCGGDRPAERARTYLDGGNVAAVDLFVLSHTDEDHAGGVAELLREGYIRELVLSEYAASEPEGRELAALCGEAGCVLTVLSDARTWELPSGTLTVFPPAPTEGQQCLTSLLSALGTDAFFAGDISEKEELWFTARGLLPDLEVLTVAHHGSRFGTSQKFLAQTAPEYGIISVGENSYGHPNGETLSRLAEAGCTVFLTRDEGDITLRITRSGMRFL